MRELSHIQKYIRLPRKAVEIVEKMAFKDYGVSFNEYIRTMVISKANLIIESQDSKDKNLEAKEMKRDLDESGQSDFIEKEKRFQTTNFRTKEEHNKAYDELWEDF